MTGKRNGCLYMFKKGSVSIYFLSIFILITTVISVIAQNNMCRTRALENLRRTNDYLSAEEAVIRFISCSLKNGTPVSGHYAYAGVSFYAECGTDSCLAQISSPVSEMLDIQLCTDMHIYDYVPIRDED